ncbi:MAG: ABC transporter permease [Cyclobacteriaceae bacterium]
MIRNYLLISLRNFQRQKLFALLNMFGLALGIASAILIFLYVSDELQYDTIHPNSDNTYRIGVRFTNADGRVFNNTVSPGFFVKQLRDTRTEVINATRIDYIGYPTSLHHKANDKIIMVSIVLLVVVLMAFISGSYPAIYLSAFRPSEVLKGQVARGSGAEIFRKTLVTIQYTVSLVLIISTFIVIRQMDHMQNTKLNQQGSQLLSIRYGGIAPQEKFAAFKNAVLQDKDIEHVTMANHLPRLNYFGWIGATIKFPEFQDKEMQWNQLHVDWDFMQTYEIEFIAGRDFIKGNLSDSSSMVLNEAAVKALNQPLEKIIGASVIDINDNNRSFTVIGVVKDFPYRSMHQVIEPLILNPRVHFIDRIAYVKLPVGKFQEKIQYIEKVWKEIFPNVGFDYWFVSDEFNRMYLAEGRVSSLAKSFAVLAILITALGVFGLASYTAEQKNKEVGIRKVLGAAVKQVVGMFLMIFLKIFIVASVIAVPMAYFMADSWLEGFAYRSTVSPLIFIVSLLGLLLITLVTVGYETWKAARSNPVNSLRTE